MMNRTLGPPCEERLERATHAMGKHPHDKAPPEGATPRGARGWSTHPTADPFAHLNQIEHPATILVVDDEPSIAELLCELLESAGYRPLRASNARTALAIARRERPALVLTDRNMPEIDGIELVHRLRASPVTNTIPVVLMSSMRPDLEACGNVPFLAKPFDLDDVLRAVATHAAMHTDEVSDLDRLEGMRGICRPQERTLHNCHKE